MNLLLHFDCFVAFLLACVASKVDYETSIKYNSLFYSSSVCCCCWLLLLLLF